MLVCNTSREGRVHHPTQRENRVELPQKPGSDVKTLEGIVFLNVALGNKRHDAIAFDHPPVATHTDLLLPAVAKEVRPDVEGRPDGERGRELHGHCWGDGEKTARLPGADPLNAILVDVARRHVGVTLQVEEAFEVE